MSIPGGLTLFSPVVSLVSFFVYRLIVGVDRRRCNTILEPSLLVAEGLAGGVVTVFLMIGELILISGGLTF